MSETTVSVLTPPGSGAVAVLEIRGPRAWSVIQSLFRTSGGKPLANPPGGFCFGRLGDAARDEVILSTIGPDRFEIHSHGGPRVIAWLVELFRSQGATETPAGPLRDFAAEAARLLPLARTTRTAGILLDQVHGAYDRAIRAIEAGEGDGRRLDVLLRRNANVGRHLVSPWTVAIAGLPNAGKSSLLNALVGFGRSVVSPTPGTTRDAISAAVAFDGWPIDLIDTAGLRDSGDAVEAEGVGRARSVVESSDLVLWIVDATGPRPPSGGPLAESLAIDESRLVVVFNKTDLAEVPADEFPAAVRVSAATGAGLAELVNRIARCLVPEPPAPGDPVPVTPEECDRWSRP
jgi:tRNA modification GTPase